MFGNRVDISESIDIHREEKYNYKNIIIFQDIRKSTISENLFLN